MALIVQKYGGATLATIDRIKLVADRVKTERGAGQDVVVVVSAMGKATDLLIHQAHDLADEPSLRDMDTLLNTGEMVSMSLLAIALNAIGCRATGLCGYQAGIKTDDFFSNASISEIDGSAIRTVLDRGEVAVVAGFQGHTTTGALTTLGRGGSDTTALALAATLSAERCEILKDVSAVYSADPNILVSAQPIGELTYAQLLEMTFWGAKVLQYRSVEIAEHFKVPLYVGPAFASESGTQIKEMKMIEDSTVLSLNSHETVLQISVRRKSLGEALTWLKAELGLRKIPFPQILHTEFINGTIELFITAPKEIVQSILTIRHRDQSAVGELSSVTATCRGSTRPDLIDSVVSSLEAEGIRVINLIVSAMSVTVFVEKTKRVDTIKRLHQFIRSNR